MVQNKKLVTVIKTMLVLVVVFTVISITGKADPVSANEEVSENSEDMGSWCFFELCTCPAAQYATIVSSDGCRWYVTDQGDKYMYSGLFVEDGFTISNSFTVGYTTNVSYECSVGSDVVGFEETLGFSIGLETSESVAYSYTNTKGYRMYLHGVVEYEEHTQHGYNKYARVYPSKFSDKCTYVYDEWIAGSVGTQATGYGFNCFPEKYYDDSYISVTSVTD